jgi:hypothetical protein
MLRIALAILMLLQLLCAPWAVRAMSLQHVACDVPQTTSECCCCCGESCGCGVETEDGLTPLSTVSPRVADANCRCPVRAQPSSLVGLIAVTPKPQATVKPAPVTIKPIGPRALAQRIATARQPFAPTCSAPAAPPSLPSLCRWMT